VVVGIAGREDRLALAAEEALTQGFVACLGRQQVGAMVVAGWMAVERLAVADHRAVQCFVEQPQALDQRMNGAQHGAGDVIGVNLIARHQQGGGAFLRVLAGQQQAVGAEQAIGGRVMGFAAGPMQQVVKALAQHQAGALAAGVKQVRGPVGNALAIDQQVVFDGDVARQGLGEVDVQQVDEGVLANCNDLAIDFGGAVDVEFGLQRLAADQPDGQPLRFEAAQYGACEYEGQWG